MALEGASGMRRRMVFGNVGARDRDGARRNSSRKSRGFCAMTRSLSSTALAAARSLLSASPVSAIRGLQVEQREGALLISGKVDSFYLKQLAQETLREAVGDLLLRNEILVDSSPAIDEI